MEGYLLGNLSKEIMRKIKDKVHKTTSLVDALSLRWEEADKQFGYTSELLEEKAMQVKLREELLSERIAEVEEKERKIKLLEDTIVAKLGALEEKENEFDSKQVLEASILRMALEMENEQVVKQLKASMMKKYEELMSEVEARKDELSMSVEREQTAELERKRKEAEMMEESHKQLEAREKEISLLCEAMKEKSAELKKKEENFRLKRKEIAEEIELRSRNLELKEKKFEEKVKKFESDGFSDYEELYSFNVQNTDFASTSEHIEEITEIMDIDEDDEDSEPFDCPDPDFNDFNMTMKSFAVGQVWALYDPIDDMPRYYARIRNIFSSQLSLQVTWLEPVKTMEDDGSLPLACGRFRYGNTEIKNYLMFSHEMHDINIYDTVFVNPRKGETWALFREWNTRKNKPSYMLDFVEVLHDFDNDLGVGVMYLGKVEGFVSVFKRAEQHGVVAFMIPPEEMGRFSHRAPSFRLTGEVKEGVPAGSFELDPAAIPTYIHGTQSKDCSKTSEVEEPDGSKKDLPVMLD